MTGGLPRRWFGSRPWLQLPQGSAADPVVKPAPYLPIYEASLEHLRRRRFTLLELGVWSGESLRMWREAFPRAFIVGVDISPPQLDLGDRVHILEGDQSDAELMSDIRRRYAPDGFEVVVDDASHLGVTTALSLKALFAEYLRPGGLYFIEDWGTGYMPAWHDGGKITSTVATETLADSPVSPREDATPIPMPSHDLGMVGLVKRLIDHAGAGTIGAVQPDAAGETLEIESMTIWDGLVLLRKRG